MTKGKANMSKRHFDLFSAAREIAKILRMLSKPFRLDFASMLLHPDDEKQAPPDIAQHAGLLDYDLLQENARRLASKMRGWSTQEIQIAVELAQRAVDWLEDLESREESSPESTAGAPSTATALPVTAESADLKDQQGVPPGEVIETPPIIAGSQSSG